MSSEQGNDGKTKSSNYRRGMTALTAVLLLAFVAGAAYWWFDARYYETTDDAYVSGDVIPVSSELVGTVSEVGVNEGDRVAAGMKLVVIDNAPARLKLERAEADLAKAVRQIRQLVTSDGQFQASLALRQVELLRKFEVLAIASPHGSMRETTSVTMNPGPLEMSVRPVHEPLFEPTQSSFSDFASHAHADILEPTRSEASSVRGRRAGEPA